MTPLAKLMDLPTVEVALPAGAATFVRQATSHGWEVRHRITRGPVPTTGKDNYVTAEIAGVWLHGYGFRAFATWERQPEGSASAQAWKWRSAAARPLGRPHHTWWKFYTMAQCKAFLMAKGWVPTQA